MKTEYHIVVIDDNTTGIDGVLRPTKKILDQSGIVLKCIPIPISSTWKLEDNREFIEAINHPELDMLLIDFNLDNSICGDTIIRYIREKIKNYHTPIIFYTAQEVSTLVNLVNDEREKTGKKVFEGIYYSSRDDLDMQILCIIQSLLKQENSVKRSRGLLLNTCSEIESQFTEIFELISQCIDEKNFINILATNITLKNKKKRLPTTARGWLTFLKNEKDITAHIRAQLLCALFSNSATTNILTREDVTCFRNLYQSTTNKRVKREYLMNLRNAYSHQTESMLKKQHNPTRIKQIRTLCVQHLANIHNITQTLNNYITHKS